MSDAQRCNARPSQSEAENLHTTNSRRRRKESKGSKAHLDSPRGSLGTGGGTLSRAGASALPLRYDTLPHVTLSGEIRSPRGTVQ